MPTNTYTPLANITLGSSAASVTFSSISQAYRDLILVVAGKSVTGATTFRMRMNGDTGSNYNTVSMYGTGSSTGSGTNPNTFMGLGILDTAGPSNLIHQVMDYSATDKHKTVLNRSDTPASYVQAIAGRWASTAAITSLVLTLDADTFASGTSFALYGIAS